MRQRVYEVIELAEGKDRLSRLYDLTMMAAIIVSLIPLAFKGTNVVFDWIDRVTVGIFILDYLLRLLTADKKLAKGAGSFLLYPFTDIFPGLRMIRLLRLFRTFRVFRTLKMFRYAKSFQIILDVIRDQRVPLLAVCSLAAGYVLVSALIVFNVEPDTFENFFEAVYWATVSLTTVGYGDIYPVTTIGRVVTMVSSFVGIAIVALPAGIITAGYMDRIQKEKHEQLDG